MLVASMEIPSRSIIGESSAELPSFASQRVRDATRA
jgi:hypothetical protein